jgi:type I restriction enzyme S subunit
MSDWARVALRDAATIEKGRLQQLVDEPVGISCIGAVELDGGNSGRRVPAVGAVVCQPTDVIMLWDGERSGLVAVGLRGAAGSTTARIRPKAGTDGRFLFHSLRSRFSYIQGQRTGTGVPHVPKDLGDILTIHRPPLAEQRRVAEILDAVDMHIVASERHLEKQCALAVAFERSLFERLSDRPLVRLDRLASVDRGRFTARPRNDPTFYGGPYPFAQTGDVTASARGTLRSVAQTLNDRGRRVSRSFPRGSIAVTIAANIADTAILSAETFFPDSVVGVVAHDPSTARWLEMCIHRAKQRLEAVAPQSAQKNINLEDLRPLLVPDVAVEEQRRFGATYEQSADAIAVLRDRLWKLRALRSGLADDLLSGRVRTVPS